MPFIDRNPTQSEQDLLQVLLSSFSDGSGWERESDGTTRVGWRQMERVFAYFFTGDMHKEDKDVFDIAPERWGEPNTLVGISVKSKELKGKKQIFGDSSDDRLYLEVANSPSKFWGAIREDHGLYEVDFRENRHPNEIGNSVLKLIRRWHEEAATNIRNRGLQFDLENSCYLTVSYSAVDSNNDRHVKIHSHPLYLPDAEWEYASPKCLRGSVTINDEPVVIYDWYGLSGGQIKYYPPESQSRYRTQSFKLLKTENEDFFQKSTNLFPEFKKLGEKLVETQRRLLGVL